MFRNQKQLDKSLHTVQAVLPKGSTVWSTLSLILTAFLIIIAAVAWVANENQVTQENLQGNSQKLMSADDELINGDLNDNEEFERVDDDNEYIGYIIPPSDETIDLMTNDTTITDELFQE